MNRRGKSRDEHRRARVVRLGLDRVLLRAEHRSRSAANNQAAALAQGCVTGALWAPRRRRGQVATSNARLCRLGRLVLGPDVKACRFG